MIFVQPGFCLPFTVLFSFLMNQKKHINAGGLLCNTEKFAAFYVDMVFKYRIAYFF